MDTNGLPRKYVLKLLKNHLKEDLTYDSGKILGSMCSAPLDFAKKIYIDTIEKNLGDSGLFPGSLKLEKEAIKMIGSLLSNENSKGHIVSGGTEANLLAMWAARNLKKVDKPELIVPESAHFSFDKAANILQLKLVKINLNEKKQVDIQAVKRQISHNTIAIVGMAGSTDLGVIDQIDELSDIAIEQEIYLHVDAAFGGFVIPFIRGLGYSVPDFDFKFEGVSSITVDPHKMGLAPIPSGGILFRNSEMLERITIRVPYLAGGVTLNDTILGTRSGASAISVWAILKHMGMKGYQRKVLRCLRLTKILADGLKDLKDVSLIMDPVINIVGFTCNSANNTEIVNKLRKRGWALSLFPKHIRVVVMPHLKERHIRSFLKNLKVVLS